MYSLSTVMTSDSVKHNTTQLVYVPFPCTVALYKLQDKQKSGTKLSMYLIYVQYTYRRAQNKFHRRIFEN